MLKTLVALFFGMSLCVAQIATAINCGGITEDFQKCFQAAKGGNVVAQFAMGYVYETGSGAIVQDYEQTLKWYRLSAEQGSPAAQIRIGLLYAKGNGVSQDAKQALRWFRLAADQGVPKAQALVGTMYDQGDGVPQDYDAAVYWYQKAAQHGDDVGQLLLGEMYKLGWGVPQDYIQAHMWLNLSSAQGNVDARKSRDEIATKMTPAQIADAQRLAREFRPKAQ